MLMRSRMPTPCFNCEYQDTRSVRMTSKACFSTQSLNYSPARLKKEFNFIGKTVMFRINIPLFPSCTCMTHCSCTIVLQKAYLLSLVYRCNDLCFCALYIHFWFSTKQEQNTFLGSALLELVTINNDSDVDVLHL